MQPAHSTTQPSPREKGAETPPHPMEEEFQRDMVQRCRAPVLLGLAPHHSPCLLEFSPAKNWSCCWGWMVPWLFQAVKQSRTPGQPDLGLVCVFGRWGEERGAHSLLQQQDHSLANREKQKYDLSFNCAKWQIAYRQGCPLGKTPPKWLFLIS